MTFGDAKGIGGNADAPNLSWLEAVNPATPFSVMKTDDFPRDETYLSSRSQETRDQQLGVGLNLVYPGAPSPKLFELPGESYFSPFRMAHMLEYLGWKYHGKKTDDRKMMRAGNDKEKTEELEPYGFDPMSDLARIMRNAEKRIGNYRETDFGSWGHAELVSQELKEAGWSWSRSFF
jgi:hypothetical protein